MFRLFRALLSTAVLLILVGFLWSAVTGVRSPLQAHASNADFVPLPEDGPRVRVEVLNGAGTPGAARAATRRLRDYGFDVVYFGNADRFDYARSQVVLRAGDTTFAEAAAKALHIDSVRTRPDSLLALEVTVILGKDHTPFP